MRACVFMSGRMVMNTNLLDIYTFTNSVNQIQITASNSESFLTATMLMVSFACGLLLCLIITNRLRI